jgi:hypothetical protein
MIRVAFGNPRAAAWQGRLSRVPRWGWAIIGVSVVLPIVLLLVSIAAMALLAGAAAIIVVMLLMFVRALWLRMVGPKDDGRRNVKIVVRRDVFLD